MNAEPNSRIKELNDEQDEACKDVYRQRQMEVRVAVSEGLAMAATIAPLKLKGATLKLVLECVTRKIMELDESK